MMRPRGLLYLSVTAIVLLTAVYFLPNFARLNPDVEGNSVTVLERRLSTTARYSNSDDVTVVTAYFSVPRFPKGSHRQYFSNETYAKWAKVFANILNPLIVYTDSDSFFDLMSTIRKDRTKVTTLVRINNESLWAFQREPAIRSVFNQPGYPKHLPNTVIPAYSCAQHAKVEVLTRAAVENIYHTNYFAWVDVGYYRDRQRNKKLFTLMKPSDFNNSRIAMTEVYTVNMNTKPEAIFKGNHVWVGGGLILAHRLLLPLYEQQYKRAFEYFLSQKLMNTDQQVLFATFSNEGRKGLKPEIELQVYKGSWFHLGNLMIREG